jgi:hypothetical protein
VGLYFKVNTRWCFISHINAENALTYSFNIVTKNGGEWIAKEVKQKLFEFQDGDNWNIRSWHFGQDLYVQCPEFDDIERDGKLYQEVGLYVVQGIYEFFASCSQGLAEDVESCKRPRPSRLEGILKANSRRFKIKCLEAKARFLKDMSARTEVMNASSHHGFVMWPSNGNVTILKGLKYLSVSDLGDYIPIAEPAAEEHSFFIKLGEDDSTAFPRGFINARVAEMIAKRQQKGRDQSYGRDDDS